MNPHFKPMTAEEMAAIRKARAAKVTEWGKLQLRQQWADEAWMNSHLSAAGVRIGSRLEPATPKRLLLLMRRAGFMQGDVEEAVGCTAEHFLSHNRNLPLWAATALALESTGRVKVDA